MYFLSSARALPEPILSWAFSPFKLFHFQILSILLTDPPIGGELSEANPVKNL
jgi:hypothetical protein